MSLYDKMLEAIHEKTHGSIAYTKYIVVGTSDAAKACEEIAKADKIALLKELKSDTINTNSNFRLKLSVMIEELESKLKQDERE